MKFFQNLRARMRRRRRIKAAMTTSNPLRQFVYLDEVSVYSLLASREGALASEYTATETTSATGGSSGSIGLGKTSVSAKTESSRTQSLQVLRKSSVQAAFKDLRTIENVKLAIAPTGRNSNVPRVTRWSDIEKGAGTPQFDGWIIDPERLARGELIEMKVELQAQRFYRIASIISAFEGIFEGGREFFDASMYSNAGHAKAMADILTRLMVGLIPVECRATDYRVVEVNGRKQIIHLSLLGQVDSGSIPHCEDLYVTGVAEEASFWKDVRGVLFSGATYYVMCRLNHSGLRGSWIPVKLVDVLRDVVPDMDQQVAQLEMMSGQTSGITAASAPLEGARLLEAAVIFSENLGVHYGVTIPRQELMDDFRGTLETQIDMTDVEARRRFFSSVVDIVQGRLPEIPSAELVARIREVATLSAGFDLDGTVVANNQPQAAPSQIANPSKAIIDTEIIAIYW
jgi:hypothetical protein